MSYEPEIIISNQRDVLKEIANPKTLTVCWEASNDSEFMELCANICNFNLAAHGGISEPTPFDERGEHMVQTLVDSLAYKMGVFRGYDPFHVWVHDNETKNGEETIPHRDHDCLGVFFYFNERGGLGTTCVPEAFAGEANCYGDYLEAQMDERVIMPPQGLALIKLGKITHCAPANIPEDVTRVVGHVRYDFY